MFSRFLYWLILPAMIAFSVPAAALTSAQEADLERISLYLNQTKKFKTRFVQITPDGARLSGTLYMNRPGKMRLDYDPPEQLTLLASHKHFTLIDHQSDEVVHYPFFTTPASLLLADNINLKNPDIEILDISTRDGLISLTLAPADKENRTGKMILYFRASPIILRGWQIIDLAENYIAVELGVLQNNVIYDKKNFFLYQGKVPAENLER